MATQRSQPTARPNDPRARIAALSLLGRSYSAASDEELSALLAAVADEHRDEIMRLADMESDPASMDELREGVKRGRMNGVAEAVAAVLTDAALTDCITELGDAADMPNRTQILAVLPTLTDRHGLAAVRLMMASAICGEAAASPILVELLKKEDPYKLPPVDEAALVTTRPVIAQLSAEEQAARDAVKAARKERKAAQKAKKR
jgi:hypothetical protein